MKRHVAFDGRGSKAAMCQRGRQRLFNACQLASILSHSYLVCLDRHSTKAERRKRQHGHNWHADWAALNYSGQWRSMLPFVRCQRLRGANRHSITTSFCELFAVVILFLRLSCKYMPITASGDRQSQSCLLSSSPESYKIKKIKCAWSYYTLTIGSMWVDHDRD